MKSDGGVWAQMICKWKEDEEIVSSGVVEVKMAGVKAMGEKVAAAETAEERAAAAETAEERAAAAETAEEREAAVEAAEERAAAEAMEERAAAAEAMEERMAAAEEVKMAGAKALGEKIAAAETMKMCAGKRKRGAASHGAGMRFYAKKLLVLLISIFVLSVLVFYMARLAPGDPLVSYYGARTEKMSVQERADAMERLGLNAPVFVQYIKWAGEALRGNFGISYKYKQDVLAVIAARMGNTLILGGIGFVLLFVLSLLLGIFCAYHADSLVDRMFCVIGTAVSCIPEFWLSLLLILIFSVNLHWLPSSGAYTVGGTGGLSDRLLHMILPLSVVVLGHLWYYAYMIRNQLLEEMRGDYVLLARIKGLTKRKILFRHCLKNILPTYLGIMAISVPHVLGGTYIVETVFSYPGIGTLAYESARYQDYNLLMVLAMLSGILVICCNLLGQIIGERIDPRIRAIQEGVPSDHCPEQAGAG